MFDRAAIRFFLKNSKRSVFIFYLIIGLTMLCSFVINLLIYFDVGITASNDFQLGMSGTEIATIIFIFVAGLCTFREPFQMMIQNGFSRKAICANSGIGAALLALFMAAIDSILGVLGTSLMAGTQGVNYQSLLMLVFPDFFNGMSPLLFALISLLVLTVLYLSAYSVGYFIAVLYYRMNKALKISVSIGVPVLFTIVIPIIDEALLGGRIATFSLDMIKMLIGYSNGGNPFILVGSSACAAAVFLALSYLLSRRAVLKT
jgi:hypothetical protein